MEEKEAKKKRWFRKKPVLIKVGLAVLAVLVIGAGYQGYLYASTPEHLRKPQFEHSHIRTQILVDGKPVDFAQKEFQVAYDASSCSAELTGQPVDFHDNDNQMAHIHWRNISGGEFLKYYGWNITGGEDDSLGRRYDQGVLKPHKIATAGKLLPTLPEKVSFYVYTGDENNYQQRDWNEFLSQDFETFFGKKSQLNAEKAASSSILDLFISKAYAHGTETHPGEETMDKDQLERINNLLGNVVIFAQSQQPTDEQVKDRFNNLSPLHSSVCGG